MSRIRDQHNFCELLADPVFFDVAQSVTASPRVRKRRLMAERRRERGGSRSEQEGSERRVRNQLMWLGWHHFGSRKFRKMLRKWRKWRRAFTQEETT